MEVLTEPLSVPWRPLVLWRNLQGPLCTLEASADPESPSPARSAYSGHFSSTADIVTHG